MKKSRVDRIITSYEVSYGCGECGQINSNTFYSLDNLGGTTVICDWCGKYTKITGRSTPDDEKVVREVGK